MSHFVTFVCKCAKIVVGGNLRAITFLRLSKTFFKWKGYSVYVPYLRWRKDVYTQKNMVGHQNSCGGRYETSRLVWKRSARGRTARYGGSDGSVATPELVSRDLSPLADHSDTPSPIYLLQTRGTSAPKRRPSNCRQSIDSTSRPEDFFAPVLGDPLLGFFLRIGE